MRRLLRSALLAGGALLAAVPSAAQDRSRTSGFHLAAHGGGTIVQVPNEDAEHAAGYGGSIGYGVGRLQLHVAADVATMQAPYVGEVSVLHGDIGLRFHFRAPHAALVPFVGAAFTRRSARRDDIVILGTSNDVEVAGSGLTLGGGLLYFLSPSFAARAGLAVTGGEMDELRINGEPLRGCIIVVCEGNTFFEGSGRLALGLSWFPGALH